MRRIVQALLLLLIAGISFRSALTSGLSADGVALLAFKTALTEDPLDAFANWSLADDTPCAWEGVSCNAPGGMSSAAPAVVTLSLPFLNLSGIIAPQLGSLAQLRRLDLQGNRLNGTIPPELFNATNLQEIFLAQNRLAGFIPAEIGGLLSLKSVDFSGNYLVGTIPPSLSDCLHLQSLVLRGNFISGPIPASIGNLFNSLQHLDLSANLLQSTIPASLGRLSALQGTLNLSYNHLSGPVPSGLGDLPYTLSIDLSHNNLSGHIPQDGSLSDQGPIPFLGNPHLCGFPLNNACPPSPVVSPSFPHLPTEGGMPDSSSTMKPELGAATSARPNLTGGAIAAIAIGDAVGVAMVGLLFLYLCRKSSACRGREKGSRKEKQSGGTGRGCSGAVAKGGGAGAGGSTEESDSSSVDKMQDQGDLVPLDKGFSFELEELLRSSAYVLGKSGLGIVYKVVLGNGITVAVRRLDEGGIQKAKDFEAEVQALGRLRHPNVVRLRAYYWADDEKLLIYDYVPNGSLAAALHGDAFKGRLQSPSRMLSWAARLKIAQGAANGLAYLHESHPRKCVHGNMKATKVLLDAKMEACITDFGLTRLTGSPHHQLPRVPVATPGAPATSGADTVSASSSIPAAAVEWHQVAGGGRLKNAGSFYRAPEATSDPKPTQKWDVFSFGVILIELLTGKSPAFQIASQGTDLVSWIRKCLDAQKKVSHFLDPALVTELQASAADATADKDKRKEAGISALLDVALACTQVVPDQRPKMRLVADSLARIAHS